MAAPAYQTGREAVIAPRTAVGHPADEPLVARRGALEMRPTSACGLACPLETTSRPRQAKAQTPATERL